MDDELSAIGERIAGTLALSFDSWKSGPAAETIFRDTKTGVMFSVTVWKVEPRTDIGHDI